MWAWRCCEPQDQIVQDMIGQVAGGDDDATDAAGPTSFGTSSAVVRQQFAEP